MKSILLMCVSKCNRNVTQCPLSANAAVVYFRWGQLSSMHVLMTLMVRFETQAAAYISLAWWNVLAPTAIYLLCFYSACDEVHRAYARDTLRDLVSVYML